MRSKQLFSLWEAQGYHVTPVNYYEPVPDTRTFSTKSFEKESTLPGIELNEQAQLLLLRDFSSAYSSEYSAFRYGSPSNDDDFYLENGSFETVDAEILYCMVRRFKPRHIIEVGAGHSTRVTAAGIRRNASEDPGYRCDFTCIEPYPKDWIRRIPQVTTLLQSKVENVPLETFAQLESRDVLFIDSSHMVNVCNDVCFEYLEVLPRLQKGVLVHVHDVVLPRVYCKHWFDQKFFWNEQYLLQAFLAFNTTFRVLWAAHFMHLRHPNELANAFGSYLRFKCNRDRTRCQHGHKSFWIQRVA